LSVSRRKILRFSLLAFLFFGLMVAWLGFGERGFIHLYRMEKERQAHLDKIQDLEQENRELLEEIERLRDDAPYVESLSRRELGLVKDDEVLYRFVKERRLPSPRGARDRKPYLCFNKSSKRGIVFKLLCPHKASEGNTPRPSRGNGS
jgi:cell division protein FtsB